MCVSDVYGNVNTVGDEGRSRIVIGATRVSEKHTETGRVYRILYSAAVCALLCSRRCTVKHRHNAKRMAASKMCAQEPESSLIPFLQNR